MNRINLRALWISVVLFLLPLFAIPVRGSLGHQLTTYTYGSPFSWLSVHFDIHGGRLFLWQALATQNRGISIDFITAILNFIILFIAVRAIIVVFGQRKRQHRERVEAKKVTKNDLF